ncbi:MAG TPA: 30S ribosomal protein S16 [Polyangiaceae bacterium]|nr:30S ribosomal protein S16 [Polyangiaceae bacterium]
MAVHIRLARHGAKKSPFYRIVVTDQRSPRDGRFIENLGTFHPAIEKLDVNRERIEHWRSHGAKPSATLERLLKKPQPTSV